MFKHQKIRKIVHRGKMYLQRRLNPFLTRKKQKINTLEKVIFFQEDLKELIVYKIK